jgi:hypothetical protein
MTKTPINTHVDTLEDTIFQNAMDHATGISLQVEEALPSDTNFLRMMRSKALF